MKYKEPKITKKNIISISQFNAIFELGYRYPKDSIALFRDTTCDGVIDWLRRKFHVIIYNSIEPFVDPCSKSRDILFRFSVKYCNVRDGWNGRMYIGQSKLTKNIYAAKREAITIAIRWIKKNKYYGKRKKNL